MEIEKSGDIETIDAFINHVFSTRAIVSTMNESESESIAKQFKESAGKLKGTSKHGEDLRSLKSQFRSRIADMNSAIGDTYVSTSNVIDEINAEYGVALAGNKMRVVREEYKNGSWSSQFTALEDIVKFHDDRRIKVGNKLVNVFSIWNQNSNKNKFEGVVFNPRNDIIIKPGDRKIIQQGGEYNLWQGFVADLSKATSCEKILWHIEHIWCSGDPQMYQYVLTWISKLFQEPWRVNMPFLVLGSEQGSGKGMIIDKVIIPLLGNHGFNCSNKDHVLGRFNSLLSTNIFVFFDETFFSGDHESASTLKSFVNPHRIIELKGIDAIKSANFTKGILASNSDNITKLELKERRFVYPNVSNKMADNAEYFDKLDDEIEGGGREAFLDYMLRFESAVDVGARDIEKLNHSPIRYRDKIHSAHPMIQMFIHLVMYGFGEVINNISVDTESIMKWEKEGSLLEFSKEQMMEIFHAYCDRNRIEFKYWSGSAFHNIGKFPGLYANHNKSKEEQSKNCITITGRYPERSLSIKPRSTCRELLKLDLLEDL